LFQLFLQLTEEKEREREREREREASNGNVKRSDRDGDSTPHTYHTARFCGASAVSSVTSVQPRVTWSECCCCGCCYCRLHFYRHVTACV